MKKGICILFFGIMCILTCLGQKKRVVIETSFGGASVDSRLKEMFQFALENGIDNSDQFESITNRNEYAEKIQNEFEAQEGGLIRDDQWVSFGKAKGADLVVYVKIAEFDDQYFITVKMFDIESGVAGKTLPPISCHRSELVKKAEELAGIIANGGMSSGKENPNAIDCRLFPGSKIDRSTRRRATWSNANDECRQLGPGWRLPTETELKKLIQSAKMNSSLAGMEWERTLYWTSSERNSSSAFVVEYPSTQVTYNSKSTPCAFRCIKTK